MSYGIFATGSSWNKEIYFIHFDSDFDQNHSPDELSSVVLAKLNVRYKERSFDNYIVDTNPFLMAWVPKIDFQKSIRDKNFPGNWYDFHHFLLPKDLGNMYYKTYSWDEIRNMAVLNLVEKENIDELPLLNTIPKEITISLYKKWFGTDPVYTDYSKINFTSNYGVPTKFLGSKGDFKTDQECGNYARWLANKILEK